MLGRRARVAVCQMNSGPGLEANLEQASRLVEEAVTEGAQLVTLPENAPWLGPEQDGRRRATGLDGEVVGHFRSLARRHEVMLLLGSFIETGPEGDGRGHNTSVLIGADGELVASYRKIHLFDVETPDGQVLRESASVAPGEQVVLAEAGAWRLGLSVCYDLRFPELYRALMGGGATMLCVPAAFTAETGRDHWIALLRARAIENLCYVVAPNQWGVHFGQRRSYGRSVVIDPWGNVVCCCPDRVSVSVATVELDALEATRQRFPCLAHRRPAICGVGAPG